MQRFMANTAAAVLAVSLVVGCGGSTPPSQANGSVPATPSAASQPSTAIQKVTLRLDWLINGYDAPFVLARDKGFYKDAGLEVDIPEGKGSATTAETVGNGSDTFGVSDAGTVAQLISKGLKVKMLAVYLQKAPFSFIYKDGMKFDSPKDLKGKTVITSSGDANYILLPAVLKRYGMTEKDLNVELVDVAVKVPAFLKGSDNVLLGFNTGDYLRAKKQDPHISAKLFADFGVNPYSIGLLTSDAEIQQHPDVVKKFMAATTKGWEYALKHQDEAVAAVMKGYPKADTAIEADGLQETTNMIHTPATEGHVVGWMADADWKETVNLMHDYAGMQTVKPLQDYYTDDYLPSS